MTAAEQKYDVQDEGAKIAAANVVILQAPIFWMGLPWGTKKYLDDANSKGPH